MMRRMAKRDYGSGSITSRGGGRWQVRWYEGPDPVTGERRRRSETIVGTKRDAVALLAQRTSGRTFDATNLPVADAIEAWRAQAGHELGTARNYDLALRTLPAGLLRMEISEIRAGTLNELYRRVVDEHGIHRTRLVHALLSGALTHAWRMEWIATNPARRVRPPAQPRRAASEPATEDVVKLLQAVETDPQLFAWLLVSSHTGARRAEVLALRWSNVDIEAGRIVIENALDPVDGHLKDTKTHGRRVVAVGPAVVEALRRWRVALAERALASVGSLVSDPFVFTEAFDGSRPWRPDTGTHRFARIRTRAGVPSTVRLHDLRHYVATVLLASGVDPKTVAARLGHTRVSTTTDLYAHAMPARDQAAAELLEVQLRQR
jgi:integrase